jgi:GNAT superfamily N-acetyltransferase
MRIRPLRPEDDRSLFDCGDDALNRFFREFAYHNQQRLHVGVTYVAEEAGLVLGFITLAACSIEVDRLTARLRKRLPAYPLPALRVARLAVAREAQGQGLGSELVAFAGQVALGMSEGVGCFVLVVDAKPAAVRFYERFGFEVLEPLRGAAGTRPRQTTLFLPTQDVRAALG